MILLTFEDSNLDVYALKNIIKLMESVDARRDCSELVLPFEFRLNSGSNSFTDHVCCEFCNLCSFINVSTCIYVFLCDGKSFM